MPKSWGVVVVGGWVVVAYSILVSAQSRCDLLGFKTYWVLVGVGPRGFWD